MIQIPSSEGEHSRADGTTQAQGSEAGMRLVCSKTEKSMSLELKKNK